MSISKKAGNLSILLIEDDEDDYVLTRELCEEVSGNKFHLDWARDFTSGLDAIKTCDHDAFLVDYRLGEKDGILLIKEAIKSGCKNPLILLTGGGDQDIAMKALEAGAADYLIKGEFSADDLERVIRYAVEKSRSAEQLEQLVEQRTSDLLVSEGRYRTLFNQVVGGMVETDLTGRFSIVNDRYCEITGYTREELVGGMRMQDITHPDDLSGNLALFKKLLDKGTPFDIEKRYIRKDKSVIWVHNSVNAIVGDDGRAVAIGAISVDITARKQEAARLSLLASLAEITRTADDPELLLFTVAQVIGKNYNARRALFNEIDLDADTETVHRDYRRRGIPSIAGKHRISDFSPITTAEMADGKTVVNHDSQVDERTLAAYEKVYEPAGERSYVAVPLIRGGRWVASFWISDSQPRVWADDEVQLIESAAERAWLAVERLRDQAALLHNQQELENRVVERTLALEEANKTLQTESAQRLRAETQRTTLLELLIDIQEQERRRIARDLHDELGQQLTALRLNLENAREMVESGPAADLIDNTKLIAENLDADIGFLTWELRPATIDHTGLSTTLSAYIREWSRFTSVKADFMVNGLGTEPLDKNVELNLYRIVQEALNNVSKYAKATLVSVLLERSDGNVSLIIEDDGLGFHSDSTKKAIRGLGLIGMRERATVVGGTIVIESAPGRGTTIFVRVPVGLNGEALKEAKFNKSAFG